MTVIEELMATVRAQQQTIEFLTSKLEETNAKLGETNAKLEKANARIAELEEQLHKDSHNSSKPPSSDGYEKPSPKSQRKKSGRKAGGQTGHKGHHMMLDNPDRVEVVYPQHCVNCPHKENCANLKVQDTCYAVDVMIRKETTRRVLSFMFSTLTQAWFPSVTKSMSFGYRTPPAISPMKLLFPKVNIVPVL